MRPTVIMAFFALVLSAYGLFQVKYRVQNLKRDLNEIERQLEANHEAIHVLKAEWAYLNDPRRLLELSSRHLQLRPTNPRQMVEDSTMKLALGDDNLSKSASVQQASMVGGARSNKIKPYQRSAVRN
jgi:cell division protein FtsL